MDGRSRWSAPITLAAGFALATALTLVPMTSSSAAAGAVRLQLAGAFDERLSDNGRYVAFASDDPGLVPGDGNGATDVFVFDRATGATERVSVSTDGSEANGASGEPSISATGRFVAFSSDATDLVPGDSNGSTDIFVRDRVAGTTRRASVTDDELQLDGSSREPWISANGALVVYSSVAPVLLDEWTTSAIVLRDRWAGTTDVLARDAYPEYYGWFDDPRISGPGRFVTWRSFVVGTEGDADTDTIMLFDRQSGGEPTELATVYNTQFDSYDLSDDGQVLAWSSPRGAEVLDRTSNVTTDLPGQGVALANDGSRVYTGGTALRVYSRTSGAVQVMLVTTLPMDVRGANVAPAFALIGTDAPNLVPGDAAVGRDDFVVYPPGAATTPSTATAADVAVRIDGSIVVASTLEGSTGGTQIGVARYTAAGALDKTFGLGGIAVVGSGPRVVAAGIAVQTDGRIVVVGNSLTPYWGGFRSDAMVVRLTSSGQIDPSFGSGGAVDGTTIGLTSAADVLVDGAGRIVVSGTGHADEYMCEINPWSGGDCDELTVVRLTRSGVPDPSFAGDGIFSLGNEELDYTGGQLAMLGTSYVVLSSGFGVVKILPNGSLAASFGDGGVYPAWVDGGALGVVGGKPVFATTDGGSFAVTRLTAGGALDTTFALGGSVEIPMAPDGIASVTSVGAAGGGKPYIAGWADVGPAMPAFAVARLTSGGALDTAFGSGGILHLSVAPGGWSRLAALRVMSNGRVVLAGSAVPSTAREMDLGVARIMYSGVLDTTFGGGDGLVTTPYVP